MEQYAHLLIAADSESVPDPNQMVRFFDLLQSAFRFQFVKSKKDWMPGLMAMTSAEEVRTQKNTFTGEERTFKVPKRIELQETSEIPALVAAEPKYSVSVSGRWLSSDAPIEMLVTDGTAFDQDLICVVTCSMQAQPVCTGDWWGEDRKGACEFGFGRSSPIQTMGVFTHPWTGKRIEIQHAGSARFWIELEFGKWLIPKMTDSFDVLQPDFVRAMEGCFGMPFLQAGRAVG